MHAFGPISIRVYLETFFPGGSVKHSKLSHSDSSIFGSTVGDATKNSNKLILMSD